MPSSFHLGGIIVCGGCVGSVLFSHIPDVEITPSKDIKLRRFVGVTTYLCYIKAIHVFNLMHAMYSPPPPCCGDRHALLGGILCVSASRCEYDSQSRNILFSLIYGCLGVTDICCVTSQASVLPSQHQNSLDTLVWV